MAGVYEILGRGGFGTVRRVVLPNMQEVARKKFDPLRFQEFNDELYWFTKVQRPNKCEFVIDFLVCYLYKFILIFLLMILFIFYLGIRRTVQDDRYDVDERRISREVPQIK